VEPGIKPAVKLSASGRIGVMATPATMRSDKFNRLLQAHRGTADILLQPCPGLAKLIEQGRLDDPALLALIETFCAPLRAADVDTVVLGCTHYPFVRHAIQAALGARVQLIDTAAPVAQQAWRLLGSPAAGHEPAVPGLIRLQTTGDVAHLTEVASRWLAFDVHTSSAPAA
jgi:glutamate racemase